MKMPVWVSAPESLGGEPSPTATAASESDAAEQGVQGNLRLTAATGIVLVALLAVEAVTLLSVRQMITLHIFVGVFLLGPVLLKTGSTMYRFVRYYRGAPAYQKKGPPHPIMRILGPFLIVSSLALLGTGITLIFTGDSRSNWWLTAHQTCFWIWVALLAVHLLGHLWEAMVTSWTELRASLRGPAARHRRLRYSGIVLALVAGVAAATFLLPHATSWTDRPAGQHSRSLDGARP